MNNAIKIAGKPALSVELHCHTEESRFDSAASVRKMVEKVAALGVKKMAVTEHGVLTSADTFASVCREYGIEPVFGLEAYVRLTEKSPEGRCHMCLYAKSDAGKRAISEAVTESFYNMEKEIPVMNAELLSKYFAKGSYGHGEVIATSACISGVICGILQTNEKMQKEIDKLQSRLEKTGYVPLDKSDLETQEQIVLHLTEQIEALKPVAGKKFGVKKRALKKMTGADYDAMKAALDTEMTITEEAASKLKSLKEQKKKESKKLTVIRNEYKDAVKKADAAKELLAKIESCKQNMDTPENLKARAKKMAQSYERLFGKGNFYLEIQYHRMAEEKAVMPVIAEIAKELDMPIVATNDAHMTDGSSDSIRAREIMRSLRFMKSKAPGQMWQEAGIADKELYVKTERELRDILSEVFDDETIERAMNGREELLSQCHLSKEEADHYPKFSSEIPGESSEECLRRKVAEGAKWRFPNGMTEEYKAKVEYELDVMCRMNVADYHLIVQDYMEYARYLGKYDLEHLPAGFEEHKFDKEWLKENSKGMIGLGVGPGRGSAAGSRVCYLLGITDIDPEKYGLVFERFLNPERISMPDIDCDMATSIRDMVYDYVCYKYGKDCVCHIMTKNRMQARASVDYASKLLGDRVYSDTTHFQDMAKKIKGLITFDELPDRSIIVDKFAGDKNALRIYDDAKLVLGVFKDYGMHAAGVVISDGVPVQEHIPCMMDTKTGVLKTQCTMTEVEEAHHLLKMDFLGLLNLDIITETLRMIEKRTGKTIEISEIPFENEVFKKIYAKGFTNGIFQVESNGMKQMMKQANPKTIEDIIILVSMYRPGPMDSLPKLLPVMAGKKKASYLVPELEPILAATYGCIVYQEQVMRIVRDLAGYSYGRSDLVRRAMSKKKVSVMEAEKQNFIYGNEKEGIKGCVGNGITAEDAAKIWAEMEDFAKYAFNKSHAAAYSVVSYYTAWLKYHYPAEYITAALSHISSGTPEKQAQKRKGFADDLKTLGIPFMGPDINKSEAEFSIYDGKVYFGLSNIKEVAGKADAVIKERRENGKFRSLGDFIYRTRVNGSTLANLIYAGAFDSICPYSRSSMYDAVYDIAIAPAKERKFDAVGIIRNKTKALENADTEKKKENALKALSSVKDVLDTLYYTDEDDSMMDVLVREKEVLGLMLSGHPADDYGTEEENGCIRLSEATEAEYAFVMGQVTELRTVRRKSDGKAMAFFSLDMPNGEIKACCFAREYEKYGEYIRENAVIKIGGKISEVTDDFNGEDEKALQIIAKNIAKLQPKPKEIIVYGDETTKEGWADFRKRLAAYEAEDGFPLILFNLARNRFQETGMFVSKDILKSPYFQAEM